MPATKTSSENLASIAETRARLTAQMEELDLEEMRLRENERDGGRKVLMAALGTVKIAEMARAEVRAIALAIATRPAAELVLALGAAGKSEPI